MKGIIGTCGALAVSASILSCGVAQSAPIYALGHIYAGTIISVGPDDMVFPTELPPGVSVTAIDGSIIPSSGVYVTVNAGGSIDQGSFYQAVAMTNGVRLTNDSNPEAEGTSVSVHLTSFLSDFYLEASTFADAAGSFTVEYWDSKTCSISGDDCDGPRYSGPGWRAADIDPDFSDSVYLSLIVPAVGSYVDLTITDSASVTLRVPEPEAPWWPWAAGLAMVGVIRRSRL